MNSIKVILAHFKEVIRLFFSLFIPANFIVVFKNAKSLLWGQSWIDYINKQGNNKSEFDNRIEKALDWISHSQDRTGSGGVACYEFFRWTTGYPEVTGYIIPTYWDCHHQFQSPDLAERALRMAEWELGIQLPEGGFEGNYQGDGKPPVVFNTGQVIRGYLRTWQETKDQRFLDAAVRAGDWIISNQEEDGSWTKTNYKGMKRVYDTYVAAPLADLAAVTGESKYAKAAELSCRFAMLNQHENGWFELADNSTHYNEIPVTHTISYTVDGLLDAGVTLGKPEFVQAAKKTADKMMHLAEIKPMFYGRWDEKWKPRANYVCLTGSAQLGIIMMKLYKMYNDPRYLNASLKILDFLAFTQDLNAVGKDRAGGIAGSYPIWGLYSPFKYPSWAAKYYIDLLLMVKKATED